MTSTATTGTASRRSSPGSWARKQTTSSSIPIADEDQQEHPDPAGRALGVLRGDGPVGVGAEGDGGVPERLEAYADRERPAHHADHRHRGARDGGQRAPQGRPHRELPGERPSRASRTPPNTSPPTMLCLRPTASIARNPAQNASPAEIRRTARSESQHDAITSGMPKSSPLAATGSIWALPTRAAVATATQAVVRRTAAGSTTPARRAISRVAAAAASTSRAQPTAPTRRWV